MMTTPTSSTTDPLGDKVALVTGGARRVGRAVALELARSGMHVAITCHTRERQARQTVAAIEKLGRRSCVITADLALPDAAQLVHDQFVSTFNRLDAMINNASRFTRTPFNDFHSQDFDHELAVNARAPLLLIQRFAAMLAQHHDPSDPSSTGRVVNFVDVHVLGQPMKSHVVYNASKAALLEITRSCAIELAPKVTVNAVAPGVVEWAEAFTNQHKRRYLQRVPLARPGTPQDAADAVRYLVRQAHYCTGQVIRLDGGRGLT